MKRINRKALAMALLVALMMSMIVIPAQADKYSTSGDGKETSIFFVESYGNAVLNFSQTQGKCQELTVNALGWYEALTGEKEEWGKYHIYVETPSGGTYCEDWDKTYNGGSFTLNLNNTGTYMIKVVPYTANEITGSWTVDIFAGWTAYPQWWVSGRSNCSVMSNVSTSIYVQKVDQDTGAVLASESRTVSYGSNTVSAGTAPAGYTLASSSSKTVNVDKSGRADASTVTFYYKKNAPVNATLTVYCYDENSNFIQSYTETISGSKSISPRAISGYTATSGSTYITYYSTGACSPSAVTFFYRKNPTYATVTVYCYDNSGNYLQSYTETISGSKYISPKAISGYSATTGSKYINYYSSSGTCDPSVVYFYYNKNASPSPSGSGQAIPSSWDTQFKPGSTGSDNQNRYLDLKDLYDDNVNTTFWWLVWKSERTDEIPELTAYFNSDTVSSISVRNGYLADYSSYARPTCFRAVIYHSGGVTTTDVYISDVRSYDYQTISLGRTYYGVTRIELFLQTFRAGTGETMYYLCIADMKFNH